MNQRTKTSKIVAYLFAICFMVFINFSCSDDTNNDANHLGEGDVSGIIVDDHNSPLQGVLVTVIDTDISTTTDASGSYTLVGVPIGKHVISFSKTDYQTVFCTVAP